MNLAETAFLSLLLRDMPFRRAILVLTLALAWCWGAWHEDMEAAGWMFDHDHQHQAQHAADQSGSHEGHEGLVDDHQPVWARDLTSDFRVLPLLLILLGTLALAALWFLARGPWRADVLFAGYPIWRERACDSGWHIAQRCTPDVAAPPALS